MRHLNLLSLLAGLGLGVMSAAAPGCAPECAGITEDDYTECTSIPGLRYTVCGSSNYEFNDGAYFTSQGLASDYCYCGNAQVECTDGRLASLCNFGVRDGSSALVYDNGDSPPLEKGAAVCLGYDSCTLQTKNCSFNGWYLRCTDGSVTRYVSSGGRITTDQAEALLACNPSDADGDAPAGRCVDAITDCAVLPDCDLSAACQDDFFSCSSVVLCYNNDDLTSCAADPACKWELY